MQKIIICNLDLLKYERFENEFPNYDFSSFDYDLLRDKRIKFISAVTKLCLEDKNAVWFYSRNKYKLAEIKSTFELKGYNKFNYKTRYEIDNFIRQNMDKNSYFVFVGTKNDDFFLAMKAKALFIVPEWLPNEDRTELYGVHVKSVKQLYKFIKTLNNQNHWYSELDIDKNTKAISLMDAKYIYNHRDLQEKEIMENFDRLLKKNRSRNYYKILRYHFLACITNCMLFNDIELFGMIPSSNCSVNADIFSFMTETRLIKGKHLPRGLKQEEPELQNLLVRHTQKNKAHIGRKAQERAQMGADEEFATLKVNNNFKTKIDRLRREGKLNICIFDDYMTHGNGFNAVRNMLEYLGANKIIFVSIGIFRYPFQKRDYEIYGSVFEAGYDYELKKMTTLNNYIIEEEPKREISDLYDIFHL